MARSKATKKLTKKSAKKAAPKRRIDQNSNLIILAGGFLLILFIGLYLGFYQYPVVKSAVQKTVAGDMVQREMIISIQNKGFTSPVTVTKGTKVTWINNDSDSHTVTSDDGSFNLGILRPNQTKSYTFTKTGTYRYHCSIHGGMDGTVIVE